jgi:hypothetical protein
MILLQFLLIIAAAAVHRANTSVPASRINDPVTGQADTR